jgi:hypothetical protein
MNPALRELVELLARAAYEQMKSNVQGVEKTPKIQVSSAVR